MKTHFLAAIFILSLLSQKVEAQQVMLKGSAGIFTYKSYKWDATGMADAAIEVKI